ncbi:MAG: hypothetical protein MK035_03005 [Dehalococcoidia bacterium]|nr:hypothetical protein [Dehalococcoidia bacterium]
MSGKNTGVFTIHDAVPSLRPNSEWSITSDDNINHVLIWYDTNEETEPTQAEIDAEVIRLQAEYDAQEYARKRQAEYPPWNEQLDKIFHDGVAKWKSEMVQPVKDKYPKPE